MQNESSGIELLTTILSIVDKRKDILARLFCKCGVSCIALHELLSTLDVDFLAKLHLHYQNA